MFLCPLCEKWTNSCPHTETLFREKAIYTDRDSMQESHFDSIEEEDDMGADFNEVIVNDIISLKPGSPVAINGGCSCDPDKNRSVGQNDRGSVVNIDCHMHKKYAERIKYP